MACSGTALPLHIQNVVVETLTWLTFYVVFISPSKQLLRKCLKLCHDRFLPYLLQLFLVVYFTTLPQQLDYIPWMVGLQVDDGYTRTNIRALQDSNWRPQLASDQGLGPRPRGSFQFIKTSYYSSSELLAASLNKQQMHQPVVIFTDGGSSPGAAQPVGSTRWNLAGRRLI
jgi:hypothetical protein